MLSFTKPFNSLPGPPLTQESAFVKLLAHNVTLGIGIEEQWSARNTRFDAGWVCQTFFIRSFFLRRHVGCTGVR